MKKKRVSQWVIVGICVFCNAVCAGLWLYRGLFWGGDPEWFYVAVGVIWALVALVWCVRLAKRPRKQDPAEEFRLRE